MVAASALLFKTNGHQLLSHLTAGTHYTWIQLPALRSAVVDKNGPKGVFIQENLYPSFPRAHHPIIRDSTSIWEFTGLVLVQVGNRSFRDSCIQDGNPSCMQYALFTQSYVLLVRIHIPLPPTAAPRV
jgi:hypothetical protein